MGDFRSIVTFNMNFYLISVIRTWSPQECWTSSFGRLQKALEMTAQVRPHPPCSVRIHEGLWYGERTLRKAGRVESWGWVPRMLRRREALRHCDAISHEAPLGDGGSLSAALLLCQTQGFLYLLACPGGKCVAVVCLTWQQRKECVCHPVISRDARRRNRQENDHPGINDSIKNAFDPVPLQELFVTASPELNSKSMSHYLVPHFKSYGHYTLPCMVMELYSWC